MEQDMTTAMPQMDMGGAPQQKSGKGLKVATVLMTIVALCGVGFGIFGIMQGSKKDDLKIQVKNADGTVTTLETDKIETTNENGSTTVTITDSNAKKSNPIISATAPEHYGMDINTGKLSYASGKTYYISLGIDNGKISSCNVIDGDTNRIEKACDIDGIADKIYKIATIGEGQDGLNSGVAFILEDGSVEYFSLNDALEKSDFSIKKLKIDGFVTDILDISIWNDDTVGGYHSAVFVLSDGTYVKYDESMLE